MLLASLPPSLPPSLSSGQLLAEAAAAVQDWDQVQWLSRYHGVTGILQRNAVRQPLEGVPAAVLERFARRSRRLTVSGLALAADLVDLCTMLDRQDIPHRLLKGPALSQHLFGDPCIRVMSDLDILVPEAQAQAAIVLLQGRGYRLRSPAIEITAENWPMLVRGRGDVELIHPETRRVVELHWRWQRNEALMGFDPERVWDQGEAVKIGGTRLWMPEPTELVLYLCVHGTRHGWDRLKWLLDLIWWRQNPDLALDWVALDRRAAVVGAQPSLHTALLLMQRLAGQPLPDGVRLLPVAARLADAAEAGLHARSVAPESAAAPERVSFGALTRALVMEWRMSASWGGRLRGILWGRFLRPNDLDLITLALPPGWLWLYGPLKPFLWLYRRVRRIEYPPI